MPPWQFGPGPFLIAGPCVVEDDDTMLRVGETLYFRTIPKLTRPVIRRGVESKSPLQFTGVPDQRP